MGMYLNGTDVHSHLYVVAPSKKHVRYAQLARKGTLPDRLTRHYDFLDMFESIFIAAVGVGIALVAMLLTAIVQLFFAAAASWVFNIGIGIAVGVGVGIPVLAFVYRIVGWIVQKTCRSQRHWADKLKRLPRTFELDGSTARPAIQAVGPDWIRQHAGNYGGKIDDFLRDPTVTEAEALMERVDFNHPAYSAAADKLRLIAEGDLHSTVLELEQARHEVEAAKAAAEAQQKAVREQEAIDALQAYTTSDLDTKVTAADVARGQLP